MPDAFSSHPVSLPADMLLASCDRLALLLFFASCSSTSSCRFGPTPWPAPATYPRRAWWITARRRWNDRPSWLGGVRPTSPWFLFFQHLFFWILSGLLLLYGVSFFLYSCPWSCFLSLSLSLHSQRTYTVAKDLVQNGTAPVFQSTHIQ